MTYEKISSNEMREMMNRLRCISTTNEDRIRMMAMSEALAKERDERDEHEHS